MTAIITKHTEKTQQLSLPTVQAFLHRYGEAHLLFACHAALPLGLTPELLYSLWANFQTDSQGNSLDIPWVATGDLLLSNLCEEVGAGIYEMSPKVRMALLDFLECDHRLELRRTHAIATFLSAYVQPQLNSENLDSRDFAQAQSWLATAYLQPEKAAKELASTLANAFQQKSDDLLRVASIVSALNRPLANYPDLLAYAQGMVNYAQGDFKAAQKAFDQLRASAHAYDFSSEGIPLPSSTQQKVEIEQKHVARQLSVPVQLVVSLAVGSVASGMVWGMRSHMPRVAWNIEPIHPALPTEKHVAFPDESSSAEKEKYSVPPNSTSLETKQSAERSTPDDSSIAIELEVTGSEIIESEIIQTGQSDDTSQNSLGVFENTDEKLSINSVLDNSDDIIITVSGAGPNIDATDTPPYRDNPPKNLASSDEGIGEIPPVDDTTTEGTISNGDSRPTYIEPPNASNPSEVNREDLPIGPWSEGYIVRSLQIAIARSNGEDILNPELKISGIYGEETADAVAAYQLARNLPSTGFADEETLREIGFDIVSAATDLIESNQATAAAVDVENSDTFVQELAFTAEQDSSNATPSNTAASVIKPQSTTGLARIRFWQFDNQNNQLTFTTNDSIQPSARLIFNPTRLIIDLPSTTPIGPDNVDNLPVDGVIKEVRVSATDTETNRFVIEYVEGYTIVPEQVFVRGESARQWTVTLPNATLDESGVSPDTSSPVVEPSDISSFLETTSEGQSDSTTSTPLREEFPRGIHTPDLPASVSGTSR